MKYLKRFTRSYKSTRKMAKAMGAKTISDASIRQAMIVCRGNLSAAAKMLGMSRSGIGLRVRQQPNLDDLREQLIKEHGSANRGKGFVKPGRQQVTIGQIEQALKAASGGVALAARTLGVSYQALRKRIQSGPESEALQGIVEEIQQTFLSEAMIAWRALIRGEELPGKRTPNWSAVDKALRVYGGLVERHELTGLNGAPISYEDVDAAKKRAAAELRIWRNGQEATAA